MLFSIISLVFRRDVGWRMYLCEVEILMDWRINSTEQSIVASMVVVSKRRII